MKYEKSDLQRQIEVEKLTTVLDLHYNQGKTIKRGCAEIGITDRTFRRLRQRYAPNNFETQLKENGFDPDSWKHGWLKVDGASIHISNDTPTVTWEDHRDDFLKAAKKAAPKYPTLKRDKLTDGHLLVVDIADLHVGKFSHPTETGVLYNIEEAVNRAHEGLAGLLQKSSGFPIDQILFVAGNDILHVDSPHRKTTSGTPQDTDGNWYQAYIAARDLYIAILERLVTIADVHVIFNPSNHDYMIGGALIDSIASWFHNTKQITFDCDMRHRKYFQYGNSLIGTTHGDGAKEKDLGELMATEAKELWAATDFRYFLCHHVHHLMAKDRIGYTVEYLRSASSQDSWHTKFGYVSIPAVTAFIHSKDKGQIAKFTHYF